MQPESVLARDVAALRANLLEQTHSAREGLAEALFLGGEDAVDLVAMLVELGIAIVHLLDHDVGETSEERRLEPDARRLAAPRGG